MLSTPRHRTRSRIPAGRQSAGSYRRMYDLPRLLPLLESELVTTTLAQHLRLLGLIRRALRRERMRGIGCHWAYDLARHAALLAAYRAERSAVADRLRAAEGQHR